MDFRPATDFTAAQLAECFTKAFKGYVAGDISFTADELVQRFALDGISTERGIVACEKGSSAPMAFSFMALREDRPTLVRLASFGVVPELKGKGVGTQLVAASINAERARGTKVIELECINQNPAGVALYKKCGFTILRDLNGWERDALSAEELQSCAEAGAATELQECTIEEVRNLVREYAAEDMPWQAWAVPSSEGSKAYRLGKAYCVVSNPVDEEKDTIRLQSLIVLPEGRGKGAATTLASTILAKFPGKKWLVTAHFPKEYGVSLAKRFGFREHKLTQCQMRYQIE